MTVGIFVTVTDFFKDLLEQPWFKLRKQAGILAAEATGLAYNTYGKYLNGKKSVPAPEKSRKKPKKARFEGRDQPRAFRSYAP